MSRIRSFHLLPLVSATLLESGTSRRIAQPGLYLNFHNVKPSKVLHLGRKYGNFQAHNLEIRHKIKHYTPYGKVSSDSIKV